MANFPHVDGSIDRRGYDYIIRSIDPGIGLRRVEQRLDHHQKAAAVVGPARGLEVDAGIVDHFGQGVVELDQFLIVLRANVDPDHVQVDQLGKAAQ